VIFRSLFPIGMTVFDPLDETAINGLPSMSHLSARQEYKNLVASLHLPLSQRAKTRIQARKTWQNAGQKGPLEFDHMSPTLN